MLHDFRVMFLALVFIFSYHAAAAQENSADKRYLKLVESLDSGMSFSSVDILEERKNYAETDLYLKDPNSTDAAMVSIEMAAEAQLDKKEPENLSIKNEKIREIANKHILSVSGNLFAAMTLPGQKNKAKRLKYIERGRLIFDALKREYSGENAENAIPVLSIFEPKVILDMSKFVTKSRGLVKENGKVFDVYEGRYGDDESTRVWFDINASFGR